MSDLQAAWDVAVRECLTGHENCTYGGLGPSDGYWIYEAECPRGHHDTCAWCDAEPTTGFAGWADDGCGIYGVAACRQHADQWIAEHRDWRRRDEPQEDAEPKPPAELLNSPFARELAEEHQRAIDDALLYGIGKPGNEPPTFEGIGALFNAMLQSPSSDGPPYTHTFRPPVCECDTEECSCPPPAPAFSLTTAEEPGQEEAAVSDDVRKVPCPEHCRYRDREHVHLEASDGRGQIWGLAEDGHPVPLDPWDLQRRAPISLVPCMPRRSGGPGRQRYNPQTKTWEPLR